MSRNNKDAIIRLCTIGMWLNGIAVFLMIFVPLVVMIWNNI